jgi:sorbitol-specific phosphotransferase system component IIC
MTHDELLAFLREIMPTAYQCHVEAYGGGYRSTVTYIRRGVWQGVVNGVVTFETPAQALAESYAAAKIALLMRDVVTVKPFGEPVVCVWSMS